MEKKIANLESLAEINKSKKSPKSIKIFADLYAIEKLGGSVLYELCTPNPVQILQALKTLPCL